MYLEKLEIQGFKSFANKNKLIFSGILNDQKRGITVVVGPNGSGKSNIADAIRWVLGEQSTKLLRSKKNEDVIFSGSDKKSRLNMAEVSLYLNNEYNNFLNKKRKQSSDNSEVYSGESDSIDALLLLPEIVLTRKVFRDGNSEYYINNSRVRLSDIQIFLAKANFGQKTYSVIGQGMVENFLNTSPAERKSFFDEATGVKQYQIKRDISLNKLENSQENLSKVEMLLNEIEPRLKSLTRQVNKLKKRKFLEEELFKNQYNYYNKIWQDINEKLNSFNNNILKLEQERQVFAEELENNKNKLNNINQGETIGEEFYELQKRFLFLKSEEDRAKKQLERIFQKNNVEEIMKETENNQALTPLIKEQEDLKKIILENSQNIEDLKDGFAFQSELDQEEGRVAELERDFQDKNRELSKIEAWIEIKLEKQGKFDLSFLNNRHSELKNEINNLKNEVNNSVDEIEKKEKKINELKKIEIEISEQIREMEEELSSVNTEESPSNIKKINQKLELLIKKIEDNKDLGDSNLLKKIIIEIESEIKELLSFSSGDDYKYKVEKINSKINEFKNEKDKLSNKIYFLQIEYNSEINKKNDWQDNLNKKEKELIDVSEKIKLNKSDDGIDEAHAKKIEVEKTINNLNEEIFKIKKNINHFKELKNDWQEKKSIYHDIFQKSQNKLNEISSQINLISTNSIKTQSRLEDLEKEIRGSIFSSLENLDSSDFFNLELKFIKKFEEETRQEINILQEKINNFNQEQENKKKLLIDLQKNINDTELRVDQLNNNLNNNKIELTREETRIEDLENNILDDKLNINDIKEHKTEEIIDTQTIKEEIYRLKGQLELIGGIDPETEKEYEETKKRYDFLFEQTEDLNKTIKSLEKVIIELDTVIKDRFDAEFKIISEKFNEYFKILFNGGNAKIFPIKENGTMDGDNIEKNNSNDNNEVLSRDDQSAKNVKLIKYLKKYNAIGLSGVDISATPPGKRISSINMLSGGERALTAIALICAIISANPSPFVVLDEVDAALDEANSERLAKILDDLSSKTQFIVISHNRATMKKANILYGITMQDDGVSKLLSVKFDENLAN